MSELNVESTVQSIAGGRSDGARSPSPQLFQALGADRKLADKALSRPSITYWQDAWLRIRQNKLALISGVYVILLAIAAAFVPMILPYTHDEQEVWNAHLSPSLGRPATVVPDAGLEFDPVVDELMAASADPAAEPVVEPADIPEAPSGLRIVGEAVSAGVILQWERVPDVQGYRVYRSIDAETSGLPLEDVAAEHLSFMDTNSVQAGEKYYYRVVAFNFFGESEPSQYVEVRAELSLPLADARLINPDASVGDHMLTRPHYLGTDYLGRDLLARVMMGARISLFIGFLAPILYILIGIIYGSISGYFGGLIDDLMMRFADMVSTVPELLTVIMLQVFLGSGVGTLIIALVLSAWARSARQIRGEVLKIREMEFVHAAKALGTPVSRIIFRHLLPNVTGTVLVLFTLAIPQAIFTEAFLSFIGLGIAPPLASWGTVTREGAKVFLTYPHELIVPALLICVSIFAFNILGDGLRDALDPKLRGAK